ncbi:MAG: heme exporter protein CcmD [Alphaproteobacteria bacterium GM7ARS4]|nr:heme exporter protein CcmD [Alphaproteobacteria bacterium GM7ARS4]
MWHNVSNFFSMEGYAPFIWPAWGCAVLCLVSFVIITHRQIRHTDAEIQKLSTRKKIRA